MRIEVDLRKNDAGEYEAKVFEVEREESPTKADTIEELLRKLLGGNWDVRNK